MVIRAHFFDTLLLWLLVEMILELLLMLMKLINIDDNNDNCGVSICDEGNDFRISKPQGF